MLQDKLYRRSEHACRREMGMWNGWSGPTFDWSFLVVATVEQASALAAAVLPRRGYPITKEHSVAGTNG